MKTSVYLRSNAIVLLSIVLIILTFSGCADSDETTTTSASAASVTTTAAAASTTSTTATPTTTSVSGAPTVGGTMVVGIGEPAFIDPPNLVESEGIQVASVLFDSLAAFDPKTSELVPAVADTWESSPDATVWTFHLKKGTSFHNGREVKAQDFAYAWQRLCDPASESLGAYHLAAVKGFDEMQAGTASELTGVMVVDDYTLEVTLAYPFADFEYVVGHPSLAPLPAEAMEADPAAYAEMPIGNGPFKMVEPWNHDQYLRVVRFDDYYGGQAYVDGVDFQVFKDPETAFLAFRAGTVDFSVMPNAEVTGAVEEYGASPDGLEVFPGQQAVLGPEATTYFFVFNLSDPVLANADVRRAVSLAINREAIAEIVFAGVRQPASSIVPPGIVGYEEGAWPYSHFDREGAGELLAAAGYPDGEGLPELVLSTNSGGGHEEVMQLVQADLKAIGIESRIEGTDVALFLEHLGTGEFQIARYSWTADYPIIDTFLFPLFSSESGDNISGYSDPSVDRAIVEARQITSVADRVAAYQAIVRNIGEAAPTIPIVSYNHQYIGSDRVRGLIYSPLGLCNLESCWLSAD